MEMYGQNILAVKYDKIGMIPCSKNWYVNALTPVMHVYICVTKLGHHESWKWLVGCVTPSHYLNQL